MRHPSPETTSQVSGPFGFAVALDLARSGDAEALEHLFQTFYPRVEAMVHARLARDLRTARPWLAARFSTGDIVQEVFRSVLQHLHSFVGEDEGAFAGYLAMLVRNRIVDAVRFHEASNRDGRQSREPLDGAPVQVPGPSPLEAAERTEEVERLRSLVEDLPERERLLVRARLEGSASFTELASLLGYGSASSARRAFHTAQAQLVLDLRSPR